MQSDNGKLFIGGISWDTNEEHLKEYFSSFGEVIEVVILKDRTTGRARGFGFVVFADPEVAEIVTTEKHNIDGRLVEAKKAVPRDDQNIFNNGSSAIRTKKIFVGGLPSSVTETEFRTYFEQFGTTTDVVVMYDHNTQRPRGFGFITYNSEESVEKVLLKTFHELNGKMVEVKRAVPKELSLSPSRSSLGGGYSYGVSRVNNLFNGGYGRFSPVGPGRSGYGMNVNFDHGNVDYSRGMSPYYNGNTNRFSPVASYVGGNGGGNSSFFSSVTRNLYGNNGNGNNMGGNWGVLGGRNNGVSNENVKFGYGRNIGEASSSTSVTMGYDGVVEFYGNGGVYNDLTWRRSETEESSSFRYGIELGHSSARSSSLGYVGSYKRQSNQGIAT